jgi:DNA polymerase (family 10)
MAVRGVGPKMAATLHREFGILDLEDLRRFAEGRGFEAVPGLGDKSAARLVSAVAAASKELPRVPLAEAARTADALAAGLAAARPDAEVLVAGEVRRRCAAVARIDLLAVVAGDPTDACAAFARLGDARLRTAWRAVVATTIGLEAELHTAAPAARAVALVRATGSRRHVRQLEERAEEVGLALGRDGLTEGGERVPLGSEAELYARLGLQYVEPPDRDGVDEVRLL